MVKSYASLRQDINVFKDLKEIMNIMRGKNRESHYRSRNYIKKRNYKRANYIKENIYYRMNNQLSGLSSRLDNWEEKISDLEVRAKKTYHLTIQKGGVCWEKLVSVLCRALSGCLMSVIGGAEREGFCRKSHGWNCGIKSLKFDTEENPIDPKSSTDSKWDTI